MIYVLKKKKKQPVCRDGFRAGKRTVTSERYAQVGFAILWKMHIATLRAFVASSRCIDTVVAGSGHCREGGTVGREKPGRKSAKRLFTYRSSYLRITVRPSKEKWNKSGSLKARAKRPLPTKALPIHDTRGCENKN